MMGHKDTGWGGKGTLLLTSARILGTGGLSYPSLEPGKLKTVSWWPLHRQEAARKWAVRSVPAASTTARALQLVQVTNGCQGAYMELFLRGRGLCWSQACRAHSQSSAVC